MTVTIAVSDQGTDIRQNGIQPDVVAVMPEKEIRTSKVEDLGTNRDSHRVAETTLIAPWPALRPGIPARFCQFQSALQR